MKQVIIENPITNSAFAEPKRHFRFDDGGITSDIVEQRRKSHYFIPIAKPKKRNKQTELDLGLLTQDRIEENKFINEIRKRVSIWREGNYGLVNQNKATKNLPQITSVTRRLLEYWQHPDRERKLFFCQIEALETIIYITEVAQKQKIRKYEDTYIHENLQKFNQDTGSSLFRMALKMATGSGKTVVMSMLIAWHTLNKIANPRRKIFSDAFLIVAPGITIKDRLRVLQPNDPENYYKKLDLVPPDLWADLEKAKIVITNYHAFQLKELKEIL